MWRSTSSSTIAPLLEINGVHMQALLACRVAVRLFFRIMEKKEIWSPPKNSASRLSFLSPPPLERARALASSPHPPVVNLLRPPGRTLGRSWVGSMVTSTSSLRRRGRSKLASRTHSAVKHTSTPCLVRLLSTGVTKPISLMGHQNLTRANMVIVFGGGGGGGAAGAGPESGIQPT